ncbi:MAG: ABC transporter permease [Gemmatimonadales bacterium]|nr:ABC transporter permease [Gemmatimonadales bacterium]
MLRDIGVLYRHYVRQTLRSPVWMLFALFQPLCWLALFAPLLDRLTGLEGFPPGGALNAFTPGMLVLMAVFSSTFVGFGLVPEMRSGLLERYRVSPVSRAALLLGRSCRDLTVLTTQATLLVLVALAMGFRPSAAGLLLVFPLLLLLGLAAGTVSYRLALLLKSEDTLAQTVNFFTLPITLLSGITLPLTFAPGWIRAIAIANPMAHAVDAARALVAGRLDDPAIPVAYAFAALLAGLALWRTLRAFQRSQA